MINSFKKLNGIDNVGRGGIISMSDKIVELDFKNSVIPLSSIIS